MDTYNNKEIKILIQFLETSHQIKGTIRKLAAYQDLNYLVTESGGRKFILKISTDFNDLDFIRSQNRVLTGLSKEPVGVFIPCPISAMNGELCNEINMEGQRRYARLFPFIEGVFLAESKPDVSFYFSLGEIFARIDRGMAGLEDAILKCRTHVWDLARVLEIEDDVNLVDDASDRRAINYFLMKYREEVQPVYHKLPKGLIHGDGNDWNILISVDGGDKVAGVIDFGDMVWGARVQEVAIILAYAMMGREDFREVYSEIIHGYCSVTELSAEELSVIYYLVAARWCQTMVMAARQERQNPDSAYHQVSVQGARNMLHQWIRENPIGMRQNGYPGKTGTALPRTILRSIDEGTGNRYRYFSKSVSLSYREPVHMIGAAMQYMYSADGRTYLDCVNNIPHVGHCHPRVVAAGQRQMARLNTNTRYLYDSLDRYAEKLLSTFPSSLNKVFFLNSGSAATDLAVRLAEAHTGQCEYLVLDYAYHGNTKAAIGLSPYKFNRKGGKGKPENVTILPPRLPRNQEYSPGFLNLPPASGLDRKGIEHRRTFFAESIVGCAGQIVPSTSFMQEAVNQVRKSGGIYVADEVQTGFGRSGQKFWAYDLFDVVPDIVILGKPMGNGHPMGAVVCTEDIARSFETGMEFFSSFGGNPVSCEIGLAVLEVIEDEGLQENALKVGDFLIGELQKIVRRNASIQLPGHSPKGLFHISEVRGSGFFLGIELSESETGNPASEAAGNLVNRMKDRGFLLSTDGPYNNVIKFKPPMCFSLKNAGELLRAFRVEMFGIE